MTNDLERALVDKMLNDYNILANKMTVDKNEFRQNDYKQNDCRKK